MNRILISVDECKDGDLLAQEVLNKDGVILATEKTPINRNIIKKFKDIGISMVYIFRGEGCESNSSYQAGIEKIISEYEENVGLVKTIIDDLASGQNLDNDKVNKITEIMYNEGFERENIIKHLGTIKDFDQYTYRHSINVSIYSMLIGKWLKLSEEQIKDIMKAGLLHDVGKSQISSDVLNKRGKLTNEEFELMKKHSTYGYNIAKSIPGIKKEILSGILLHHERTDGKGYPLGVRDEKIELFPKIVAVADVYDALTSERCYKKRLTPFEAFNIIEGTWVNHLDGNIVINFLRNIANYYIDSEVLLNTGTRGKVVHIAPHRISMPIICVGNEYFDLAKNPEIKIVDMVS